MMTDSDKASAFETNYDGNPAKRPRLEVDAIMEPSTQSCDKSDFNKSDKKFLSDKLRKEGKLNVQTFYSRIREFFVDDKFTDVNIKCENQIFGCHRLILAATCEYFEIMFSENFRENYTKEITLHDISAATVKEILAFIYKGYIIINDDNVFELLCASNLFGLMFIENECTRYLLEERIPAELALEIFIFACNIQKAILIPVVSQFILEHLDHLSRSTEYLEILFDDMCLLLANFRALSLHDDKIILDAIFRWVSHSEKNPDEDKKKVFDELVQKVKQWYQYVPVEDLYQSLIVDNCEGVDDAAADVTDLSNAESFHQLPIHAYVNVITYSYDSYGNSIPRRQSEIFSSKFGKDQNDIGWHHSFTLETNISEMRTVVTDNQLYCLRRNNFHEAPTFSVSSSANLCLNELSLKIPPHYSSNNLLCCDTKTSQIYSFTSSKSEPHPYLFLYNRELDEWTSISLKPEHIKLGNCMTCHDDGRLYLFTGVQGNRYVRAYDHRDGKWTASTNCSRSAATADECCSLKGRIYVSCYSSYLIKKQNAMEIYDPRSEKWLKDIEWSIDGHEEGRKEKSHRLLPYSNHLWMFSSGKPCYKSFSTGYLSRVSINCFYVKTYNSFQQKCTLWPSLDKAIYQKLEKMPQYKTHSLYYGNYGAHILDVVAFNPL